MMFRTLPRLLLSALLATALVTGTAVADDDDDGHGERIRHRERDRQHGSDSDRDHDHDRARAALQAGDIVPLQRVLDTVYAHFDGVLLEVELEYEDDHAKGKGPGWLYEVKMRTPQGAVIKLYYDARNGALIGTRGRGVDSARRPPPR